MSGELTAEKIYPDDEERWNRLLLHSLYPSFRQSISYEYSKQSGGREVATYIFMKDDCDVAGVHYSVKQYGPGLFIVADILSGFVFKNEPDVILLEYLVTHFIDFSRSKGADYIRIYTWLPRIIAGDQTKYEALFNNILFPKGFKAIGEGRHTYWINLSKSEDELLRNMKRQTRYDVKKGLKSSIINSKYLSPENDIINEFWILYKTIAENKGFNMYSEEKFKRETISLMNAGMAVLFVETYNEDKINFSLASNFGIASYLHGAVDLRFKKYRDCPSPGHLAQWKMITEMKSRGARIYDMGFCPGPVPVTDHPAYDIWRFKYGFGGDHVEFLPMYENKRKPLKVKIYELIK